jgi:hypothetical protein
VSRNEARIRKELVAKGYTVQMARWTPLYGPFEMEGYCGGWEVLIEEPPFHLGGYNIGEVLERVSALPDLIHEQFREALERRGYTLYAAFWRRPFPRRENEWTYSTGWEIYFYTYPEDIGEWCGYGDREQYCDYIYALDLEDALGDIARYPLSVRHPDFRPIDRYD